MAFYREYEGPDIKLADKMSAKRPPPVVKITLEEGYQRIIDILKQNFWFSGFAMSDAAALILAKLERKHTTTRNAIRWAVDKGTLVRKGRGYYFTDFIKQQVAEKISAESEEPHNATNADNGNSGNLPVLPVAPNIQG